MKGEMKTEALQLYEQITNERNVIYELVGQTGSGKTAVRMGFKVLLLRQPTLQNKDEVEVKRVGKKIIIEKKEKK